MSGHSKWSTIKRKKGAVDSKRSKMFSRIAKEITIAVKTGGSEPESNPRLRVAIANGKGVNMPKENITRAISKGEKDEAGLQEVTFEGYLSNGIAVFIECLTDNNNRTVSNIRSLFNKKGGSLGTNGSLNYIFDRKGVIQVPIKDRDPDEFQLEIIDAGVEDCEIEGDMMVVTTAMEDFGNVLKKLEELGIEPENSELQRIPKETKTLPVPDSVKILKIIEDFEDDDDVQNVFHTLEVSDDVLSAMEI